MPNQPPKTLLTIAGTDPSGAAGIQVDLQVFRDFGFHGASVLTALVVQNTQGVEGFTPVSEADLSAQLDAVLGDLNPAAIKIGMVPSASTARIIGAKLTRWFVVAGERPVVLDPVRTSGDGARALSSEGARAVLREELAGVTTLLTPNAPEGLALLDDVGVGALQDPLDAAHRLREAWGVDVLWKAGHMEREGEIRDVLAVEDGAKWLVPLSTIEEDVRGTGCQLSSAIAAGLACGEELEVAVERARAYLNDLLHHRRAHIGGGRAVIARVGRTIEDAT